MSRRIPWLRVVLEGVVIVASILLALAADAWWDGRQDRSDERSSLELIDRDLTDAIAQLQEFTVLMDGSLTAALSTYQALSGPPDQIDRSTVSAAIVRASLRRTISLPSAAYTDLITTGNSRIISDRSLRDEILRFYASAERTQAIIERNNTTLIDGMFWTQLFGRGIVLPRPGSDAGVALTDVITDSLRVRLGEVVHRTDRLWELPPASPEWDSVRGSMLIFARSAIASKTVAAQTIAAATDVQLRIRAELEERSR